MENLTFGRWIKRLRTEQDLTQEMLAEKIGCAVPTLRAFETGKRRPSRDMALRVAEVLDIPAEQQARFLALARASLEAQAEDHAEERPPERPALKTSLPRPATALVGREAERNVLQHLLLDEGCRLVTVVGTGGIGKTHLAADVAAALAPCSPDGAAFLSLSLIDAPGDLPAAIAEALGLPLHNAAQPQRLLLDLLAPLQLLLVLDSFEHLLAGPADATPLLHEILLHAPGIRMLVTSRERLRLGSEHVFELSGLPVPDADTPPELTDAGILFLERARQVSDSFTLGPHNRAAVARICQMVEGMPLAIELAAAWVRTLTCQEIAAELARSIDFLALASRDAPARHSSLRAVFDHSWRLLSEAEQAALARLSVFRGGCPREAAQAVAGASLPVLAGLIDKSLVQAVSTETGTRYHLHELVRQYAADRLAESGAALHTADLHSQYHARLLLEGLSIQASGQAEWLKRLTAEADNVRAAWQWAVRQKRQDLILSMGRTMLGVYELNGWLHEGVAMFEAACNALESQGPRSAWSPEQQIAFGYIESLLSFFLVRTSQYARARLKLLDSYWHLQPHPAALANSPALLALGYLCLVQGEYAEGHRWFDLNRSLCEANGEVFWLWLANDYYPRLMWSEGKRAEALELFAETLAAWRQIGNPAGLSACLSPYGGLLTEMGELERASELIHEAAQHAFNGGHHSSIVMARHFLGRWALASGDPAEARRLEHESLELAREIGDLWAQCLALNGLGRIALSEGDLEAAALAFSESEQIAAPVDMMPNWMAARLGLGEIYLRRGQKEQAASLLRQVVATQQTTAADRERARQLLETLPGDPSSQPTHLQAQDQRRTAGAPNGTI